MPYYNKPPSADQVNILVADQKGGAQGWRWCSGGKGPDGLNTDQNCKNISVSDTQNSRVLTHVEI